MDGGLHRDDAIDPASTSTDNGTASNSKSLGFGHLRISAQTVLTKHSAWFQLVRPSSWIDEATPVAVWLD